MGARTIRRVNKHLTNTSSVGKESACNAGGPGSILRSRRSPGEGKSYPLQYSGLENSVDRIVHGVAKRWTEQLSPQCVRKNPRWWGHVTSKASSRRERPLCAETQVVPSRGSVITWRNQYWTPHTSWVRSAQLHPVTPLRLKDFGLLSASVLGTTILRD